MGTTAKNRRRAAELVIHREQAPGAVPGEIDTRPEPATGALRVLAYGPETLREADVTPEQLAGLRNSAPVVWVDVIGHGHVEALGSVFALHPLALEDAIHTHQRPKVEDYRDVGYIVVRMPSLDGDLQLEQVNLFIGPGYVITIQEHSGDCLEPVRKRIRYDKGRIRRMGADYLAYCIIDAIVDHYFPIVETYGDRLETLEDCLMDENPPGAAGAVHELHAIRRDLHHLRRVLWPTREAANLLARGDIGSVTPETQLFFRDCADHVSQLLDGVDSCRELISALMELHVTAISQRTNEIMKVLTLIATLFIPLGFVAGVYGMNFDHSTSSWNMPELSWTFGYPFALGLMAAMATVLLVYFRRKGWLGSSEGEAIFPREAERHTE